MFSSAFVYGNVSARDNLLVFHTPEKKRVRGIISEYFSKFLHKSRDGSNAGSKHFFENKTLKIIQKLSLSVTICILLRNKEAYLRLISVSSNFWYQCK